MRSTPPTYTHGYHPSVLRSQNVRTLENSAAYLRPALHAGLNLLDIGSGAGTITADFAQELAPGRVTALECTPAAVALTTAEARRRGLDNVNGVLGDALALPFPDASFDIVHAHQVLQHVSDPIQALREMRRVCRVGGTVAARDADYAGFIWYPAMDGLDAWMRLYQKTARTNGGEPNAGRHLLAWAHAAGFTDVTPSSSTWCVATPEARLWWGGMWEQRILQSRIARQALEGGFATEAELLAISCAWRVWTQDANAWLSIPHGEILCHRTQ